MPEQLVSQDSVVRDNLFAGNIQPVITDNVTLASGSTYQRGTVLGKIRFAVGAIAADDGNTGDAEIATATLAAGAQLGTYKIVCVAGPSEAAANDAVFAVYAPDGSRLADAVQTVPYAGGHLTFTISGKDSADSDEGDTYTIAVVAGSGLAVKVDSAAINGSAIPVGILTDDKDATNETVAAVAYLTGEFNEDRLIFGGSDTIEHHREALRSLGIFARKLSKGADE